jgi:lactate dehydrogenase-like 2-hydroxyacid dehydrogenase
MTAGLPVLLQLAAFPPEVQAQIDAEFDCVRIEDFESDPARADDIRAVLTRGNVAVPPQLIARLPALEIIASNGVGYDLIPLDVAKERGIVVTNTPNVLNAAVAELCVGALLALLRRLPQADRFVREGRWTAGPFALSTNLAGKHVGIVGMGRIGKEIARRLETFGVVLAYHGRSDQQLAWRFEPELATLARDSDVLIVVAPGGAETRHLVDADVLRELGPKGYLVNVARGSLVDTGALIAALSEGAIAGAALDVFEDEPRVDERFFDLENVLLLPHIGSATAETRAAMGQLTLDNLRSWFRSRRGLTVVDNP